jgi:hypothetical protein
MAALAIKRDSIASPSHLSFRMSPRLMSVPAQTVGLLSVQEPLNFKGPYSRVGPDQRKRLFQVTAFAALLR